MHMRWVVALAMVVAGLGAGASAQVPIAQRGQPKCLIVTQPGATPAEQYAAEQLASALLQVTGASIPLVQLASDPPEDSIIVGPGPVAAALFPKVDLAHFGGEELAMQTGGHRLLLAGGRPRGTVYAVMRFLQDQVGVRWWAPWATSIPKRPTLSIGDLSIREKPAFEYREPFWYPGFDGDWAAHNCVNSTAAHLTDRQGGHITYKGFVHTYYPLVPPDKYFDKHPEWYSLVNGKRQREGAQLCTSNPELRDFVVQRVKEWLRESPDANIVSVSQNDSGGWCQCPNCKAIDDREGSHSGSVLELANYVAAHIAKEYPNVAIDTLAYQYTRKAPKDLKPLPNVIVRLCSIECNFAAPLDDPSNAKFAADIRDWHRLTNRLYIWDYSTNFAHYVLPHPNWYVLGPDLRFFHKYGAKGIFSEGAYQSNGSEMAEMRAWVLAQLMWNPYQNDRKLIDEFLDGYYGKPSARYIREYLDLMTRAAKGYYLGCFNNPANSPFLKFETLSKAEHLWQQAEDAARGNSDLVWRVRQGRLPVWYAWLVRWPALGRECAQAGGAWPVPESRAALADQWLSVATGPGPAGWSPMTTIREGTSTPQAFVEHIKSLPVESGASLHRLAHPAPPPDVPAAERASAVDVQDAVARLYNEPVLSEERADPQASDLSAVWMAGSTKEWCYQVADDALPKQCRTGKWKVYVTVRVEKAAGAAPGAQAFTAGVWDASANRPSAQIAVTVGQAADGYRSYDLGTVTMSPGQYVWVAPPGSDAVKAVWVDRVFLVPVR